MPTISSKKVKVAYDIPTIEKIRFAAYMDTDGSIGIEKQDGKRQREGRSIGYRLIIQFGNTRIALVEHLQNVLGGPIFMIKGYRGKENDMYYWRIMGRDAYRVLKMTKDYYILKKERAVLGIVFFERCFLPFHRLGHSVFSHGNQPKWLIQRKDGFYLEMREMNRRGKKEEIDIEMITENDCKKQQESRGKQIPLPIV